MLPLINRRLNLVVVVGFRVAGNTRKASESGLGGSNDPDYFAAGTSLALGMSVNCFPQPSLDICAHFSWIGGKEKVDVFSEIDWFESWLHLSSQYLVINNAISRAAASKAPLHGL